MAIKIDLTNKNILIVDDSKTIIMLLESLLMDEGYTSIFKAISAQEAYDILEKQSIDIILLDVMMPEINGLEACEYIKNHPLYSHIPIIMVTGDDSNETLKKSFAAGASEYLTKPINTINMKVRVKNVLMSAHKDTLLLNQNRLLAVNETVHMLAHQWRQPLSTISSSLIDISISEQLGNLTPKKLEESLNAINLSAQYLSTTLDEFSDISQIESMPKTHNLNDTVNKSIEMIKDKFKARNIFIKTNLPEQKDILYFPKEIKKILINIFINSFEAFEKNNIKVQKIIKVSTEQTDKTTSIVITDNAGGVQKSMINKVFEPYTSTKSEKNAVGLGLYNAFSILKEFMNAEISLSSVGSTTTLTITIATNS